MGDVITIPKGVQASNGDKIKCPKCGKTHYLRYAKDYASKQKNYDVLSYRCGKHEFIGAVHGLLVPQIVKQRGRRIWRCLIGKPFKT